MNWFKQQCFAGLQGFYQERSLFKVRWLNLECRLTRVSPYGQMRPREEGAPHGFALHELRIPLLGALQQLVCMRGHACVVTYRTKHFRPDLDVHMTANCAGRYAYFLSLKWQWRLPAEAPRPVNSTVEPRVLSTEVFGRRSLSSDTRVSANADRIANWPYPRDHLQDYVAIGDYVYVAAFSHDGMYPAIPWPHDWPNHHQVRYARKYLIERL